MIEGRRAQFAELFGSSPSVVTRAPGRVNLMGEHTDYNGGLVLPMPIPYEAQVELVARNDDTVRLASSAFDGVATYQLGREQRTLAWFDYVQGVTQELTRLGFNTRGFDAYVHSDVPLGAGLASSAALVIAFLRALREAFALSLDDLELAKVGQAAEVSFVGAPVGIMDPLAASLGRPGAALFVDTHSLETRSVQLPGTLLAIVIASGVRHAHGSGDYRVRRAECEEAARQLGVASLREVTREDLPRVERLPSPLAQRVRHVVEENARVLATVTALENDDQARLRSLLLASHASQRDDYEVSVPDVDLLVRLGDEEPFVFGARLTGGGFGGSVVALAERESAPAIARRMAERYAQATGRAARVLLPLDP